jgi:hypothetical protein
MAVEEAESLLTVRILSERGRKVSGTVMVLKPGQGGLRARSPALSGALPAGYAEAGLWRAR